MGTGLPFLPPAADQVPGGGGESRVGGLLRLLAGQSEINLRAADCWARDARGQCGRPSRGADDAGRHAGLARPSNVIEVKTESSQGSHSAPFPRALVEFFVKAFTDAGDVVFDPFMGSGTTMAAAHVLGRRVTAARSSPAYCDVIVRRMLNLGRTNAVLGDRQTSANSFGGPWRRGSASADPRPGDSKSIRRKPDSMLAYGPKVSFKRSSTKPTRRKPACPK